MEIVDNTDIVTAMREKFLRGSPDGKEPFDASTFGRRCCIYIIANLKNKKCYIGKTVYLLDRANRYIYQYRKGIGSNPITRAILEFGIENFRMFPFATCNGREELAQLESYYINKYHTVDRTYGYNVREELKPYVGKTWGPSVPQSVATKMKKAKLIAAINDDTKEVYISVGMKLFGDMVGKHKDIIKNAAKAATRICGYYIIYLNSTDMSIIEQEMVKSTRRNRDDYLGALAYIKGLLEDENTEELDAAGYQCHFLTYTPEDQLEVEGAKSYQVLPIDVFFAMNQTEDPEN